MTGRLPRLGGGGVAVVDTAGEGGFFGIIVHPQGGGAAGVPFTILNKTFCCHMVLPFRSVVAKARSQVTTLQVGKFYGFGLYDMNGDLVVRTAAQSSTTTGIKTTSTSETVTVEPGPYWFCWSSDDTGIQVIRLNLDAILASDALGQLLFSAANDSVAGVLPATLGTLTGVSSPTVYPIAYFTP